MTEKEKAKELFKKFELQVTCGYLETAEEFKDEIKQCALICVGEILDVLNPLTLEYEYWKEVEQELLKL